MWRAKSRSLRGARAGALQGGGTTEGPSTWEPGLSGVPCPRLVAGRSWVKSGHEERWRVPRGCGATPTEQTGLSGDA